MLFRSYCFRLILISILATSCRQLPGRWDIFHGLSSKTCEDLLQNSDRFSTAQISFDSSEWTIVGHQKLTVVKMFGEYVIPRAISSKKSDTSCNIQQIDPGVGLSMIFEAQKKCDFEILAISTSVPKGEEICIVQGECAHTHPLEIILIST